MQDNAQILIPLGALLLLGLATEVLGRRTRLPRVTLLILFGFLIGPGVLGWIPASAKSWYPIVSNMALGMIGFLLGGKLTRRRLNGLGRMVLWVSFVQVVVTYLVVAVGLTLVGIPLGLALIIAAISTATDPAATNDVIVESKATGRFSDLLQGVVAVDDAWGLVVFSLTLVAVQLLELGGVNGAIITHGLWELGGAVMIGVALGIPMAYLSGRIRENQPILVEALGGVFLCTGLSLWLEVSYLLACVVMGAVVANRASHHERPFHAIEDIEWPFIILFFVLSGASVSLDELGQVGIVGVIYILLRCLGRGLGGFGAAVPGWVDRDLARWSGLAMLPQAGVALAMAFVAVQFMPDYRDTLLPLVIATTVLFEMFGPIATRWTLLRRDG